MFGRFLELGIPLVALLISSCLLLEVPSEGIGEIYAGLVGKAEDNPENIGELVSEVKLFARLSALIPVLARYDACELTNLFRQDRHVGKLAEVAYAYGFNPSVYFLLCLLECHGLCLVLVLFP